jgi:hypothetical protein
MSRKSRRNRGRQIEQGAAPPVRKIPAEPAVAPQPAAPAPAAVHPAAKTTAVSVNYSQFIAELRRIGIMAGAMLTVLIILVFIFS